MDKGFSLDSFLKGFVHDEPPDLDSYVSGGAGFTDKMNLIKYGRVYENEKAYGRKRRQEINQKGNKKI